MQMADLPIEHTLSELRQALSTNSRVILQAPPGAGKTTRVPLALLTERWLNNKKILMLEPRRLAASNAANFMARQLGERPGQRVGYSIRYHRQVSPQTRIEVVTEGILTRRIQNDPELSGVGLVIFDEFHERHLQSDLALALCLDVQQGLREDLKLLLMSATLNADPLADLLEAPLITSEGRSFPVDLHYLPQPPKQRLVETTVAGIRRALAAASGDILCFLPGEGEIRRCAAELNDLSDELLICPLYGNLPFAEQEKAIYPAKQRKLVLATNLAETSLTIEGISIVVDSGYCRQPGFDSGSGLTKLNLSRISQASATQRAGRAGRLGPGHCFRLWSQGTQGSLLPFTPPEIRNADLAPLALELLNWGISNPEQLTWLDPPAPAAWQNALDLLQTLGARQEHNQLTRRGKAMAQLPAHPRLASLLLAAEEANLLTLGCDLAALLSERDPWSRQQLTQHSSDSDLLDRLEELWKRRRNRCLAEFSAIDQASRYWQRYFQLKVSSCTAGQYSAAQISELLLAAYPDRIGRVRQPGSKSYLLSSGQGAVLGDISAVQQAEFLIAVDLRDRQGTTEITLADLRDRQGTTEITLASKLLPGELQKFVPDPAWHKQCYWEQSEGRVVACEQQRLGALVLTERPAKATTEQRNAALIGGIRQEGFQLLNPAPAVKRFLARGNFLFRSLPEERWPDCREPALLASLEEWLLPFLGQARNRNDLRRLDLLAALRSRYNWQQLRQLEELAPERLRVPSGANIRLDYSGDGPPVLAVKLQEMFGQTETPRIARGRIAVMIHLLSPAGRPLQITQDLPHFWRETYPEVQKEMKGRYPKHNWDLPD